MSQVIEITDEEFEETVLGSEVPTEVDFWAPWCQPCLMVSPIYDKLSREYDGRFRFCKVNVDTNQLTAAKYQIMSIPMQMFFADGEKVGEILGATSEPVIRAKVEETLKKYPTDPLHRFKGILRSWVELNRNQNEKLKRWTAKNRGAETELTYRQALEAARELEIANKHLSQALAELRETG